MISKTKKKNIPLVVDLDGTFIKKDLLYEGFKLIIRKNFLYIFSCCIWILKGKVNLKNKLFKKINIKSAKIQVNEGVLHFIEKEKKDGRKIILATASLQSSAEEISREYPFFDEVYGTNDDTNLKGKNKLKLLLKLYGFKKFDYIGNSFSDLVIFQSCRYAYLVNASKRLKKKAFKIAGVKIINSEEHSPLDNNLKQRDSNKTETLK